MKTVSITVNQVEKASRWEILIRIIWVTLCAIVLLIVGIFAAIAAVIQIFHILIYGKRHVKLNKFVSNWISAFASMYYYKDLVTDERPPIIPEF